MAAPYPRDATRTLELPDEAATAALARALAARARAGDLIALWGDLGAGKSVFARAFINARPGAPEEVPSPSFTLVQVYERGPVPVAHFDLYRVERPEELVELGFEEALAQGIVLVEWPERLGPRLPPERLDLRLVFAARAEARRAELTGRGSWAARIGDSPGGLHVHA